MRALEQVRQVGLAASFRQVFYGWWLVGIGVFLLTLMALTVFQSLGTFVVALQREFGWTRTTLSGAFALSRAEGAVVGPLEGYLIDRLGPRRMVLAGYTVMGVGFLLFSQVQSLWQFYVAFLVVTLGSGIGGFLPVITAVNHWFSRRRSLAMSIAMSGVNFGGILVPLLAFGIESHGFRWTTGGIGIFLLSVAAPAFFLIRNRPEDYGLRPDGDGAATAAAPEGVEQRPVADEPDLTARQALRTGAFWIILLSNIASGVPLTSLMVHLVPKLTDMGFSLGAASVVVTTFTLVALPATVIAGVLGDRVPKPPLICAALLLQGGAILVLALAEGMQWAWVFAPMYGLAFGARIPLTTAMRGEYFGRKAFATISGLSQFPSSLAMMGGPLFAGYLFDLQKSYYTPFVTFAALSVVGAVLILFAKKPKALSPVAPRVSA